METSVESRVNGHDVPTSSAVDSQIVRIEKENDLSWFLIPQVRERIRRFCENYDQRANPDILLQRMAEHFVSDKPAMYLLVLINDGLVVGHVLGALEHYHDKTILCVTQYEIDEGAKVAPEELKAAFGRMKRWAKTQGATICDAMPMNEEWERGLRMHFGFKPYRKIVTMEL